MTYKPNPDTGRLMREFWCTMILLFGSNLLGNMLMNTGLGFAWVFQLITIGCTVRGVYLMVRWRMMWFVYAIRPREDQTPVWDGAEPVLAGGVDLRHVPADTLDFIVAKGQGSRPGAMECVLGMDDLEAVFPVCRKDDGAGTPVYDSKALREQYPGAKVYEYMQTYRWTEGLVAVFRNGQGYAVLLLDLTEETELGRYLLGAAR